MFVAPVPQSSNSEYRSALKFPRDAGFAVSQKLRSPDAGLRETPALETAVEAALDIRTCHRPASRAVPDERHAAGILNTMLTLILEVRINVFVIG